MTLRNEDRELQIELTRIQIEHQHIMSRHTIFISVFLSLIVATLSIYVPLGVQTGNLAYPIIATIYGTFLMIPVGWIAKRMVEREKQLKEEIEKLKNKYVW